MSAGVIPNYARKGHLTLARFVAAEASKSKSMSTKIRRRIFEKGGAGWEGSPDVSLPFKAATSPFPKS